MTMGKQVVTGVFAGIAVGMAVGLLFSPNPGKQNREALSARSRGVKSKAGRYIAVIRQKAGRGANAESLNGVSSEGAISL